MAAKPSIPKGTRDFSPVEMAKRNYIFNTIRDVFHLFGYQQIETRTPNLPNTRSIICTSSTSFNKELLPTTSASH